MNFVALKMLVGDRAKYLGLVFAIAFSTFLLENQVSDLRGDHEAHDQPDPRRARCVDLGDGSADAVLRRGESAHAQRPLPASAAFPGCAGRSRCTRASPGAQSADGRFRAVILLGLDDATLVGAPRRMILGSVERLREPDAVIVDLAGYRFFFPTGPLEVGRVLEMNDQRARIVGIADASAPFASLPGHLHALQPAVTSSARAHPALLRAVSAEARVDARTLRHGSGSTPAARPHTTGSSCGTASGTTCGTRASP